jgi:hypothetical protein
LLSELPCHSFVDVGIHVRHIANAVMRKTLAAICEAAGYEIPVICTPLELNEEQHSD